MIAFRAFISHAFADANYDGGVARFRKEVERLITAACEAMSVAGGEITPELERIPFSLDHNRTN